MISVPHSSNYDEKLMGHGTRRVNDNMTEIKIVSTIVQSLTIK